MLDHELFKGKMLLYLSSCLQYFNKCVYRVAKPRWMDEEVNDGTVREHSPRLVSSSLPAIHISCWKTWKSKHLTNTVLSIALEFGNAARFLAWHLFGSKKISLGKCLVRLIQLAFSFPSAITSFVYFSKTFTLSLKQLAPSEVVGDGGLRFWSIIYWKFSETDSPSGILALCWQ